jgi:N-acetylglutamate synthase-like GNAT family acetyltransferase
VTVVLEERQEKPVTHGVPARGEVRSASRADLPAISELLTRSKLPLDGVAELLDSFVVAERDRKVVGVAGVERCGDYGLLRSAAVDPRWRGEGLGRALVEHLISTAKSGGVRALYLLTTTAEQYFPSFGFQTTTRDDVPAEIQGTAEFRDVCPSSATVMSLELQNRSTAEKS